MLIQREIKDPRIGMVTISEATVSRDLAYSDVYFTVLSVGGTGGSTEEVEAILNQASGFLRSQLAKILSTRTTPKLRFHYDATIENGARLSAAIDEAIAADNSRAQQPESDD